MVKFKEKIIKNGSNKNISHPVKRENEKVLRIKHKSNESNSAVDIKNALFFLLDSVSLPFGSTDCAMRKKKELICMMQSIHSLITTYQAITMG